MHWSDDGYERELEIAVAEAERRSAPYALGAVVIVWVIVFVGLIVGHVI